MAAPINVKNPDGTYTGYAPGFEPGESNAAAPAAPAAPAPATPATPTTDGSTPSPYYPRYTDANANAADQYLNTFTAPQDEATIRAQKTTAAQGTIDALNKEYDAKRADQMVVNDSRNRGTSSVNTLTGLSGSTEANVTVGKTNDLNNKDLAAIEADRGNAIAGILSQIADSASTEARNQKLDARSTASDIVARQGQNQTDATAQLTALAKASSGATLDGLKATLPPDQYNHLITSVGGEEMAKAILFENRPKNTVVGSPQLIGDKMVQAYTTPDGKVIYENIALPDGVTPDNIQSVEKTDNGIFIIKKDGTYSRVAGSAKPADAPQPGDDPQLYQGLTTQTASAIRQRVTNFKSEPIVQNYAVVQEGRNFADSLSNTTTNPADDQGLIYALAKALDPGSVVREGEYATAQKYSQSWIKAFGAGVAQAVDGTGFLSETARTNIKATIDSRYSAAKTSYDNLSSQYAKNIGALSGRGDGAKFLPDFQTQSQTSAPADNIVNAPDGTQVQITD